MFSSYYDWNNFATDKNPALTLFIVQNFPLPSFHSSFNIVKYTTNKRITMRREHIYEKIQLLPAPRKQQKRKKAGGKSPASFL